MTQENDGLFWIAPFQLCAEIHDYLEKNNYETLFIPSTSWWQEQKQYGLIKRFRKLSLSHELTWFDLREFYSSVFIRTIYHIKKKKQ